MAKQGNEFYISTAERRAYCKQIIAWAKYITALGHGDIEFTCPDLYPYKTYTPKKSKRRKK